MFLDLGYGALRNCVWSAYVVLGLVTPMQKLPSLPLLESRRVTLLLFAVFNARQKLANIDQQPF